MLKRNKPTVSKKPDIVRLGESDKEMKSLTKCKKTKKIKKEVLFIRVLNRLLKLDCLKLLELSIGFVKGFAVKIEFHEKKNNKEGE